MIFKTRDGKPYIVRSADWNDLAEKEIGSIKKDKSTIILCPDCAVSFDWSKYPAMPYAPPTCAVCGKLVAS
jgi:hypothetical protein